MLFTPIVLSCLIAEPTQCRPVMGPTELTEVACMDSLSSALAYAATRTDIYIAGLACVETHLIDEQANSQ
jgi:hypothetical protein